MVLCKCSTYCRAEGVLSYVYSFLHTFFVTSTHDFTVVGIKNQSFKNYLFNIIIITSLYFINLTVTVYVSLQSYTPLRALLVSLCMCELYTHI